MSSRTIMNSCQRVYRWWRRDWFCLIQSTINPEWSNQLHNNRIHLWNNNKRAKYNKTVIVNKTFIIKIAWWNSTKIWKMVVNLTLYRSERQMSSVDRTLKTHRPQRIKTDKLKDRKKYLLNCEKTVNTWVYYFFKIEFVFQPQIFQIYS